MELIVDDGLAQDVMTFSISVVNPEKVLVTWDPPATRQSGEMININDLIGYELEYYKEDDAQTARVIVGTDVITGDMTSWETPLLSIGTWHFALRAIEATGFEGEPSLPVDVVVDGDPG